MPKSATTANGSTSLATAGSDWWKCEKRPEPVEGSKWYATRAVQYACQPESQPARAEAPSGAAAPAVTRPTRVSLGFAASATANATARPSKPDCFISNAEPPSNPATASHRVEPWCHATSDP